MANLGNATARIMIDAGPGFVDNMTLRLIGHDGGSVIAAGGGNFKVQSVGNENLGGSVLILRRVREYSACWNGLASQLLWQPAVTNRMVGAIIYSSNKRSDR